MQEPDGHLLTRFATHRDEAAFKALADRHLGLIYHVALRRTGNRQLAEEVSQNVLCAVVRKAAGLAKHPDRLPAWLHRATLFESSKAMRSEASIHRRKQFLHPDGIAATGDADASAWNAALPVLDLALDRLPDADRNVVLRHYFEGKSFNQIGAEVSRPAATVQKQCRRALEKLARVLRGKGVALSATALASGLASQTAEAAPATLMKSAAAKALAGAATHSTTSLTLFMAMKSKAALPIGLLLLATPLVFQQIAISRAAAHNESLRQALTEPTTVRRTATPTMPRAVATGTGKVTIDLLMRRLREADRSQLKQIEFEELIASLGAGELEKLIPQAFALPDPQDEKTNLLRHLVTSLAKIDPGLAVRTTCTANPKQPLVLNAGLQEALYRWTTAEPEAAFQWLETLKSKPAGGNWLTFMKFQAAVAGPLILSGSPHAREVVMMSADVRPEYVLRDAMSMLKVRMGEDTLTPEYMVSAFSKYLPWIREFIPEEMTRSGMDRRQAFQGFLSDVGSYPATSDRLPGMILETLDLSPSERRIIAETHATKILQTRYNTRPAPDHAEVEAVARNWLKTHSPDDAEDIFTQSKAAVDEREREQVRQSLEGLGSCGVIRDMDILNVLDQRDFGQFPEFLPTAIEQAQRIKDPARRAETIHRLEALQQKTSHSNP